MLGLENNFDEEHGYYNMILLHIFLFYPTWYGLIMFLNHYKGYTCANMCLVIHFWLGFTFDFYSFHSINYVHLKITCQSTKLYNEIVLEY
jgi:hypothetical protein